MARKRGPWIITGVDIDGPYDPQALTWKQLVAHVANNLGHIALALYELARKPTEGTQDAG